MKKIFIISLIAIPLLMGCNSNAKKQEFYVSFESNGGTHVETQRIVDGNFVTKPSDPEKDDSVFVDWYLEPDFVHPFDFATTQVTADTVLYAKWNESYDQHYHFDFVGKHCKISDKTHYENDFLKGTNARMLVVPDANYFLPKNDGVHFKVIQGGEYVSYDASTGAITIDNIRGDIEIEAESMTDYCMISFTGENCKVAGDDDYRYYADVKRGTTNINITIVPDDGYEVPLDTSEKVIIEGNNTEYKDGIITISELVGDVTIRAIAATKKPKYDIYFSGIKCKASNGSIEEYAKYSLNIKRDISFDSIDLYLFPDAGCELPDAIVVKFDDLPSKEGDYTYNKEDKKITIYRKAETLISITAKDPYASSYKITFDAGEGSYLFGRKTVEFYANEGESLSYYFNSTTLPKPSLYGDSSFAYYSYGNGNEVGYDDTVNGDITLTAHYFDFGIPDQPLDNLNKIDWTAIKQTAITNPNMRKYFKVGSFKDVVINNATHRVRIIDFNHDQIVGKEMKANITFEFENVISNENGGYKKVRWNNKNGDNSTNYDFINSTLNEYLNGTKESIAGSVYEALTNAGIKIEEVNKLVCTGESYGLTDYATKVFPLSYAEMTGKADSGEGRGGKEGNQYQYYLDHSGKGDRVKKDVKGDTRGYWLRTPDSTDYSQSDEHAWLVESGADEGDAGEIGCWRIYEDLRTATAPAFCI